MQFRFESNSESFNSIRFLLIPIQNQIWFNSTSIHAELNLLLISIEVMNWLDRYLWNCCWIHAEFWFIINLYMQGPN